MSDQSQSTPADSTEPSPVPGHDETGPVANLGTPPGPGFAAGRDGVEGDPATSDGVPADLSPADSGATGDDPTDTAQGTAEPTSETVSQTPSAPAPAPVPSPSGHEPEHAAGPTGSDAPSRTAGAPVPERPGSPAGPTPSPTPSAPVPAPPTSTGPVPHPPASRAAAPAPVPTPSAPAGPGAPRPETPGPAAPAATSPSTTVAAAPSPGSSGDAASFGRVADDGTVYVRTPEGEKEVGSYPGASPQEALAYFARKYDEVDAVADLLLQRVTQTDLSAKDAAESLTALRTSVEELRAVGDLVALAAKVENIATAVEARRAVEGEQKAAQRAEAVAHRERIVSEAERIAATPEEKVQWKSSSGRMRALLDEWKSAQKNGPRLDRETEQALWHRLSSSRNSFDKMRRVHFARLGASQSEAKAAKEELVAEAESLAGSTDWGATAGAYKRLMDRWRQAGRAARADDDALWARFKAAQDTFFAAKDEVAAAENEEFKANLAVKEELLAQAQQILPVTDPVRAKRELRVIQDKWDAAGKVPRGDMDRVEKGMRRVEAAVREAEDKKWKATNPEVAARAASLAAQAEAALERYRRDLEKAERSGDAKKIAKAREALEARQTWLAQAQAGLAEFGS